ncbi:MAG TPA: hypothetical protein VMC03_07480 [Streptosporangiaceae bacterium]|nr:hypothetical protein [Streptosporangiaceae bacterium]
MLRARRGIVINTGSAPSIPPVPGLAGTPYWTNHEAIEAERVTHDGSGFSVTLAGGEEIRAEALLIATKMIYAYPTFQRGIDDALRAL